MSESISQLGKKVTSPELTKLGACLECLQSFADSPFGSVFVPFGPLIVLCFCTYVLYRMKLVFFEKESTRTVAYPVTIMVLFIGISLLMKSSFLCIFFGCAFLTVLFLGLAWKPDSVWWSAQITFFWSSLYSRNFPSWKFQWFRARPDSVWWSAQIMSLCSSLYSRNFPSWKFQWFRARPNYVSNESYPLPEMTA